MSCGFLSMTVVCMNTVIPQLTFTRFDGTYIYKTLTLGLFCSLGATTLTRQVLEPVLQLLTGPATLPQPDSFRCVSTI